MKPWVLFDWGGTLMSEDGPLDLPMALWPEVHPIEGARETLAALSGRYGIAVATNASISTRPMIELALGRVGLREMVKEVFCYSDIGARKDSDEFWRAVVDRLGAEPDELAMIGDSLAQDVIAPSGFGLHAIWFNAAGGDDPDAARWPTVTRLPDAIPLVDAMLRP